MSGGLWNDPVPSFSLVLRLSALLSSKFNIFLDFVPILSVRVANVSDTSSSSILQCLLVFSGLVLLSLLSIQASWGGCCRSSSQSFVSLPINHTLLLPVILSLITGLSCDCCDRSPLIGSCRVSVGNGCGLWLIAIISWFFCLSEAIIQSKLDHFDCNKGLIWFSNASR